MLETILRYARDVHSHFEANGADGQSASLRGIITKRKKAGRTLFIELVDVTGKIQILMSADRFTDDEYENKCVSLRKGDIIAVKGSVGESDSSKTTSIFASHPPEVVLINAENSHELGDKPYLASGTLMIQAQIVQVLEQKLRSLGFLEIEPRLMSTEWRGNGLEPLRAQYPGFGHNVFLVPSPLPQLFEALISTGYKSIFATSKCLSTSYRDVHSSTEATTVFAVERQPIDANVPLQPVWTTAMDCLTDIFSRTGNALPDISKIFEERSYKLSEADWPNSKLFGDGLTVQRVKAPAIPERLPTVEATTLSDVEIVDYARIALEHEGNRYTLAEATLEVRFDALKVVTTTIHTEHLLGLFSTAPFRSLRTSTFWDD
ncbi:OB-fold nucleic acid binding domain-containing protein [Sulfitobacter sp. R86518]|uniref:OB-fold nucleic acid binding domain-containing protein n=1 Tax=Sulfitobacter sp. R86518 TaxID=3093858 RepID=UPI0036DB5CA9